LQKPEATNNHHHYSSGLGAGPSPSFYFPFCCPSDCHLPRRSLIRRFWWHTASCSTSSLLAHLQSCPWSHFFCGDLSLGNPPSPDSRPNFTNPPTVAKDLRIIVDRTVFDP